MIGTVYLLIEEISYSVEIHCTEFDVFIASTFFFFPIHITNIRGLFA